MIKTKRGAWMTFILSFLLLVAEWRLLKHLSNITVSDWSWYEVVLFFNIGMAIVAAIIFIYSAGLCWRMEKNENKKKKSPIKTIVTVFMVVFLATQSQARASGIPIVEDEMVSAASASVVTIEEGRPFELLSGADEREARKAESEKNLMLCLMVGAGVVLIVIGGCEARKCLNRLSTNLNIRSSNITSDEVLASPPPFTATMGKAKSYIEPSFAVLQPPDGMILVTTNMTTANSLETDVSDAKWSIFGVPVVKEVLSSVYPTNIVAVDTNGGVHTSAIEVSTDGRLSSWRPFVGQFGSVIMYRKWYSEARPVGDDPYQTLAFTVTVTYTGGVASCTNHGISMFNGYFETEVPMYTLAGVPRIPGMGQADYRLSIGTNTIGISQ